jgi:hypothetical protein
MGPRDGSSALFAFSTRVQRDDFFLQVCKFALEKGLRQRAQGVIERIIGHTGNKRQELADMLG